MKRRLDLALSPLTFIATSTMPGPAHSQEPGPWPPERAAAWAREHPWLVGCNYIPSTAINQLEMWQAETFDPATIDRELGWAEGLGFNSVRVFLHHLLWEQDAPGFLARMEQFLAIADRHKIGVVFVLFDAVWDPFPQLGKQRAPEAGPAQLGMGAEPRCKILADPARHDTLKAYVTGVVGQFRADRRVHAWDLFNEPDNPNRSSYGRLEPAGKPELALALLEKTFAWAREANPSQPLTAGVWQGSLSDPDKLSPINRYMLTQSDVISFHNYRPLRGAEEGRRVAEAIPPAACSAPSTWRGRSAARSTRSWRTSRRSTSGRTTGASSRASRRRSTRGIPGRSPMPPSPRSGSTTSSAPTARRTTPGEVAFIRRVTGKAAHRQGPAMTRDIRPLAPEDLPELGRFPGRRVPRRAGRRLRRARGAALEVPGAGSSRRTMPTDTDAARSYIARDEAGRIIGHLGLCRTAFEGQALAAVGRPGVDDPHHRLAGLARAPGRRDEPDAAGTSGGRDPVRPGGQPGGAGGRRAGGLRAAEPGAGLHARPPRGLLAPGRWTRPLAARAAAGPGRRRAG